MSFACKLEESTNTTMINKLKWLKNNSELCDVLLVSGQSKVAAHSCVLASYSPVLAAVLKTRLAMMKDWSILKPLIIVVDAEAEQSSFKGDDEYSCIKLIISFLYGEEITVKESKIKELLNLCKILGLSQHFLMSAESSVQNGEGELPDDHVIINVEEKSFKAAESCQSSNSLNGSCRQYYAPFTHKQNQNNNCIKLKPKKYNLNSSNKKLFKASTGDIFHAIKKHSYANKTFRTKKDDLEDICQDVKRKLPMLNNKNRFKILSKMNQSEKKKRKIPFTCSVCKSAFSRASHLITHAKKNNHYSQVCPLCFTQFDEYDDRKRHFSQHDHPSPFFCLCCDLRFRSKAGLAMHAPKHSDTKPYTCGECGRGFKWRHSAQAHSVTHRNHCHLLCDICGFSSKYASTFQSHLKRHYDQFFPCPHPGCTFKSFRKTHLNDHYATHAKLRPHQCEICGHSFSQSKNLRRHMRLHTPDANFLKCSVFSNQDCLYKTTRADKLRIHLFQKHKMEHHDKISLPVDEETSAASFQLELKDDSLHDSEKITDFKSLNLEDRNKSDIFSVLEDAIVCERKSAVDIEFGENSEFHLEEKDDPKAVCPLHPNQRRAMSENVCNGDVSISDNLTQVGNSETLGMENIEILDDSLANEIDNATLELEISPAELSSPRELKNMSYHG